MRNFKKPLSLAVTLCIVLSLFTFVNVSAETIYKDLSSIGEIVPNRKIGMSLNYPNYNGNKYFSISYPEILTDEYADILLEIFSDKNLGYVSSDEIELVPTENRPNTGRFHLLEDGEEDNNWTFYFDEEKVYVISIGTDLSDETYMTNIVSHGWFTYREKSVYQKLIKLINELAEKQLRANNEKKQVPLKNQISVSDIRALYYARCPLGNFGDPGFFWGVLEYEKNGKQVVTPYVAPFDPNEYESMSYMLANEIGENNTICFDMNRTIKTYDGGVTGIEYDSSEDGWIYTYKLQFNVTNDGKVNNITITFTNKHSGKVITEVVDMNKYNQSGALPSSGECAFLPENNIDYSKTESEETTSKSETSSETKNETVSETKTEQTDQTTQEQNTEQTGVKEEEQEKPETTEPETDTQSESEAPTEQETTQEETKNTDEENITSGGEEIESQLPPAAVYTSYADNLNQLGLFKGTENGYELESSFTREQGATMLVRLLGEEGGALEAETTGIFADVSADKWSAPYVEYCYNNGITKGTGENNYSPDEAMSGAQYVTLVLRALGYTYAEPETVEELAIESGLLSSAMAWDMTRDPQLDRDRMVYISYQALSTKMLSGKTLIEDLVDRGAVEESAAENLDLLN